MEDVKTDDENHESPKPLEQKSLLISQLKEKLKFSSSMNKYKRKKTDKCSHSPSSKLKSLYTSGNLIDIENLKRKGRRSYQKLLKNIIKSKSKISSKNSARRRKLSIIVNSVAKVKLNREVNFFNNILGSCTNAWVNKAWAWWLQIKRLLINEFVINSQFYALKFISFFY